MIDKFYRELSLTSYSKKITNYYRLLFSAVTHVWLFGHSSSSSKGRLGCVTHIHILIVWHKPTDTTFLSLSFTHTPLFLSLHRSFKFQWKISTDSNNIIQTFRPWMILALTFKMGVRPTKSRLLFSPVTHVWLFGHSSSSSSSKGRLGCVTHIHILTVWHKPTNTTFLSLSFTHTPLFLSLHRSFKFQWKISTDSNNIIQTFGPWMILTLTLKMGVWPTKSRLLFSPVTHVWLFGHSSSSSSSKGRLRCVTHIDILTVWHKPMSTTFLSLSFTHTPLFLSLHGSFKFNGKLALNQT